jgi:sugar phosphate permease
MASPTFSQPTRIRYGVMVLATLVAVLLYLHRYCLSTADRDIKSELDLTEDQIAHVLGAFFFTYALGQIPFGYLSDRFGARRMLTIYMLAWSTVTGLLGLARGYLDLLVLRWSCGLFEAGTYPACAGVIRRWIPYRQRGLASGIVSLGGRLGGTLTPMLTALLMVAFVVWFPIGSWRPVMAIYGIIGISLAVAFWWIYRDSPREHPSCNEAEATLILHNDPNPATQEHAAPVGRLMLGVLRNFSLWMCSLVQFGINVGWVFLVTYLNRYLQEVHAVPIETRGVMNTLVIGFSLPALILGGWLTDGLTRRFGQRWGRCLPLVLSRFVSAAAFLAIPFVSDPWLIVFLFGTVAFFSDLGLPALWGYILDVGGRNVGFVLGWGNMWGNLGAWLSPLALNRLIDWMSATPRLLCAEVQGIANAFAMVPAPLTYPVAYAYTVEAWNAVFVTCGLVFAAVGVVSFCVDATKRVEAGPALSPHIERALQDDDRTELLGAAPSGPGTQALQAPASDITARIDQAALGDESTEADES